MIKQAVKPVSKQPETKTSRGNKAGVKPSVYATRTAETPESEEEAMLESPAVHQVTQEVKVTPKPECPLCKGEHTLGQCDSLKRVPIAERAHKVAELNCCFKCLQRGHRFLSVSGRRDVRCKVVIRDTTLSCTEHQR